MGQLKRIQQRLISSGSNPYNNNNYNDDNDKNKMKINNRKHQSLKIQKSTTMKILQIVIPMIIVFYLIIILFFHHAHNKRSSSYSSKSLPVAGKKLIKKYSKPSSSLLLSSKKKQQQQQQLRSSSNGSSTHKEEKEGKKQEEKKQEQQEVDKKGESVVSDQKEQQNDNGNNNKKKKPIDDNEHYHIIFSSGCSNKQDWQSYMLFYSVLKTGQPGDVTRIVSGCKDEAKIEKLRMKHEKEIKSMSSKFHLHFTPDFSNMNRESKQDFKFFNKPFGVRHWMENVLGYDFSSTHPPKNKLGDNAIHDNDIIILLDPDQIILRPITDTTTSKEKWIQRKHNPEDDDYGSLTKQIPNITKVQVGSPMAQLYAYDYQWLTKVPDLEKVIAAEEMPSPVQKLTLLDASQYYNVGPPYVVAGYDMYRIVMKWCEFVVEIHKQYPHLLAEMFAYSMAAAHLNLKHQQMGSFAISDPGQETEYWEPMINVQNNEDLCPAKWDGTNTITQNNDGPHVFHYCQRYYYSKWFYYKHRLPHNFFSCESSMLQIPPSNLLNLPDYNMFPNGEKRQIFKRKSMHKKHVWALCTILHSFNDAATYYKQNNCQNKQPNMETNVVFFKNMTIINTKNVTEMIEKQPFEELQIEVGEID